ncbi:MAG: hypothetical protein WCA30_03310 [Dermatophilaceae bacterium]
MTTPADAEDGSPPATSTSDAQTLLAPTVTMTALLAEAAGKSDIMWVEVPGERAFPVWYAWVTDRFYVVSGEGEQLLPPLPEVVRLVLRSKDTGGRLLTVSATAHRLAPHTPSWEQAVAALAAERLNATDDVAVRWAASGVVHALHPFGEPLAAPGSHTGDSGRAAVLPAPPTTLGWRPWHAGRR